MLAEGLPAGDDPVARVAAELSADHEVTVTPVPAGSVEGSFDVVLATSWQATVHLFGVQATRYVELVSSPEQVRHVIDRAARVALGERGVSVIILPHDVQRMQPVEQPEPRCDGLLRIGVERAVRLGERVGERIVECHVARRSGRARQNPWRGCGVLCEVPDAALTK